MTANRTVEDRNAGWRRGGSLLAAAAALLVTTSGCDPDDLLDVTLPGTVSEEDLEDPEMASLLARSVQGDFECAFGAHVWATGLWADEFNASSVLRFHNEFGARLDAVREHGANTCAGTNPPPIWQPMQTARFQAEEVAGRIQGWPADEVDGDPEFLVGKSLAYGGFSYVMLGETFCQVAFDNGPLEPREHAFEVAEERFTDAIGSLEQAGTAEAEDFINMAKVGRARARLNLGDDAGALADAEAIPEGFIFHATYSSADTRRENHVSERNNTAENITVHPRYTDLEVDGEPDPRVEVVVTEDVGPDGVTQLRFQQKYDGLGADIPLASWREAQLTIAEIEGGQTAVEIINDLRADQGLPEFSSDDEMEIMAQVMDERRRELWIQGTRMGDKLRFSDEVLEARDLNWEMGTNQKGEPFSDHTCIPVPEAERDNNPSID